MSTLTTRHCPGCFAARTLRLLAALSLHVHSWSLSTSGTSQQKLEDPCQRRIDGWLTAGEPLVKPCHAPQDGRFSYQGKVAVPRGAPV